MKKRLLSIGISLWCAVLGAQQGNYLDNLSRYIENLGVYEEGQEPPRAYHIPAQSLSLNGSWKFFFSEVPGGIPADFYRPGYDDSAWQAIAVPSNWEMQGYGDKQFRNISTTYQLGRPGNAPPDPYAAYRGPVAKTAFAVTPPNVPDEYNPTGAYRTSFALPADWQGQEVFLRFEKVASASFLWVNGQQVGYNEGAQEPSEYDITSQLRPGENTIAVLVLKFADGTYLEGQDYWRLAGIFDDVWVLATPRVRLFDWQVLTDLDAGYRDAELSLTVDVKSYQAAGGTYRVKTTVSRNGQVVANNQSETFEMNGGARHSVTLKNHIENPLKWTESTPDLYDLRLELVNAAGQVADQVDTRIGFKETEIVGNTFFLNGVPVKIHGINSHMQHPEQGHVMDEATIRKDFEILKQFNFNSVRTSHYPPVNKYLELADSYGLYIVDEAGTEAHATEYLSDMPEYLPMYLDRVRKMVIRDRNHPSILFWSAGNESGEGPNITEVVREGKKLDPSRFWMYGGNADVHPGEDIVGPRYPTPVELEVNFGLDTLDQRPSYMDEYLSIAGNGGGALDDYWRVIYRHPRLMGGAIWDFVSTGVTEPVRRLLDGSPHANPVHIMGNARLVPGKTGKALDLNGHDQWVELYRGKPLEVSGDRLTIALDVLPRKLNSSAGALLTKGSNQFGLVQKGTDALEFYIFTGKKEQLTAPLPANWQDTWHQVYAVYDGARMALYIDGAEVASKAVTGAIQNLPFPVNIGRDVEAHGQDTDLYISDAQIDNVRLFAAAIRPGETPDPGAALLWLDFEQEQREGSFYSIGIGARTYGAIWPDRRPQPEMWQMKHSVRPLSFSLLDAEKGIVEVWNRSNFDRADRWRTTWTLTADETVVQSGELALSTAPGIREQVAIALAKPDIVPGVEYRLNITSTLRAATLWAPAGFEVGWEQFELPGWNRPLPPKPAGKAKAVLTADAYAHIISGKGFAYRLDKTTGELTSLVLDGQEVLVEPLRLNVWRAPLANELDNWNGSSLRTKKWKEGYGSTLATDYYSGGIDNLKHLPLEVRAQQAAGKVVVEVREQGLLHGGKTNFTLLDRYITGLTMAGFESTYTYTFSGDGALTVYHRVRPMGSMPQFLPRLGVSLMLGKQFDRVEWYGRGPQENYPDRQSGYRLGIFKSTVGDMYEPYLIPQDNGLRTENRWVRLTNRKGQGLEFAMDQRFNFNTSPYTTDNLTRALYTYQLEEGPGVTLNLDYATTGVGGTARAVYEAYRVYPELTERTIYIRPLR